MTEPSSPSLVDKGIIDCIGHLGVETTQSQSQATKLTCSETPNSSETDIKVAPIEFKHKRKQLDGILIDYASTDAQRPPWTPITTQSTLKDSTFDANAAFNEFEALTQAFINNRLYVSNSSTGGAATLLIERYNNECTICDSSFNLENAETAERSSEVIGHRLCGQIDCSDKDVGTHIISGLLRYHLSDYLEESSNESNGKDTCQQHNEINRLDVPVCVPDSAMTHDLELTGWKKVLMENAHSGRLFQLGGSFTGISRMQRHLNRHSYHRQVCTMLQLALRLLILFFATCSLPCINALVRFYPGRYIDLEQPQVLSVLSESISEYRRTKLRSSKTKLYMNSFIHSSLGVPIPKGGIIDSFSMSSEYNIDPIQSHNPKPFVSKIGLRSIDQSETQNSRKGTEATVESILLISKPGGAFADNIKG